MSETISIDFSRPIPLFPLSACVLLPHATVPLRIFEQRYREMTRDALDGAGLIAMAVYGSGDDEGLVGSPPIRRHVCVGYIARHERLPDGRYNILLQGLCRARITKELAGEHTYRTAILEPTELEQPMEIDLEESRDRLEKLLSDPALKQLAAVGAIGNWISHEIPTPVLVDLATLTLTHDVERRYQMLAEPCPHKRADWLETYLRDTRRTVQMADRIGAAVSDQGLNLN